jgi:hypothetical protein
VHKSRKNLVEGDQKVRNLASPYKPHCNGRAFFVKERNIIKVMIDSRVALDAAFFMENN